MDGACGAIHDMDGGSERGAVWDADVEGGAGDHGDPFRGQWAWEFTGSVGGRGAAGGGFCGGRRIGVAPPFGP